MRKLFKQSSNSESAGSVAAYLAMRERQKQNVAAPTRENVNDQLDQEAEIAKEAEAGIMFLYLQCTALLYLLSSKL